MSFSELMMMVAHKMLKEGSMDKGVIDQSITVLYRLVPECKFDKEASPSGKLKTITEHISKDFSVSIVDIKPTSIGEVHIG